MASDTQYVVKTADKDPAYLRYQSGSDYGWTRKRQDAKRFTRSEAVSAARALAEAIGHNGYGNVRIVIVPATGGAAIGESFKSKLSEAQEIANEYTGKDCHLNGAPARICGRLNEFATVGTLDCHQVCEFAWATVRHVMTECGGAFSS